MFMAAAAAGSLPIALGRTRATDEDSTRRTRDEDPTRSDSRTSTEVRSSSVELGGRRIVGEDGYETIAAAWSAAADGDSIYVHSSYDAQTAGETFPIVLDYSEKEVMLTGGHPSGSVIDAGDADANVIEVIGRGVEDYRNNPVVQNLKIVGGEIGLRVRRAPFSSFDNLVFYDTGSHGMCIDSHPDGGTFGTNWSNCQAWHCGGDGFRAVRSAQPHGTTYWGCRATANRGVGFRLRGTSSMLFGGTSQLNYDYGIEVRSGWGVGITGVYIEGNARGNDFPVEVYGRGADGLTIENCYFHGINPRGAEHNHDRVQRGVNVHDTEALTVRDCTARRYEDGFIAVFGCTDIDAYAPSHCLDDTDLFGPDPTGNGNLRARSNGLILPTDLSEVDGNHEYDCGYHVGDNTEGHAIWRNGSWQLTETTTLQ